MIKLFIFFFPCMLFAQWSVEKIAYEKFYEPELQEIVKLKQETKKEKSQVKSLIKIGELYQNINIEDSAYANFYKAYAKDKLFNELNKNDFLDLLLKLHKTESSKHKYYKDRRFFLKELISENEKLKIDKWQAHIFNEIAKDYYADSLDIKNALLYFKKAEQTRFYKENDDFKFSILLNLGNLYTYTNAFDQSEQFLLQALDLAKKNKNTKSELYALINLIALNKKQKKYDLALNYINQALNQQERAELPKIYRIIFAHQADIYEATGQLEKMKQSDIFYNKLDSLINDFQRNSNFYEIDTKYQLKQKEAEISQLSKKFNQNKALYLSLIFLVFLLALYSFVRWKKEDKRKKTILAEKQNLEVQHHQTIEELQKTKQLVIEDHIVLKNKAKIYLEELIYIKAEDHYLQLITTAKKEFVRGKLTEIIGELPPNFVKCHRSFIVNKNFVKQLLKTEIIMKNNERVPVSRGFKLE